VRSGDWAGPAVADPDPCGSSDVDVALGPWLSVGLRAFFDGDRVALTFDEHELAADARVPALSHDEALGHPRVEELWAMADAIWERDARLAPAGHWLLEGVPANLDRA